MPLAAGTRLDSYEIVAPLGAGGMGEVYRARDLKLKRDVAIKVLPEYLTADPERLRRFEQEARATAALNHPNILAVYEMDAHEGVSYLVEELLDGETLRERLRRGPVPLRKAIEYGVQIANGLAAAHDKGIVHRDLKPENLFLTKDGRVKILDFGLAKVGPAKDSTGEEATLASGTDPGVVMGTVGYMSPEQVRGKTADHRTDIFSFGTILYEMVTAKQPFRKPTSAETMTAILNEEPPSISQLTPTAPPGMQRVVNRCLEKSPEQRFQSAADLAFALEALSDSGSVTPSGGHARLGEGTSRRGVAIAAAGVSIAIAAALVLWWRQPPAVPVVEAITQLTDDGKAKWIYDNLLTDGSRIYYNEGTVGSLKIAQVAVTGGPTSIIPTRFGIPNVVGLTREGSSLLALVGPDTEPALPLWLIPLPTGEPRRLGDSEAQDASFSPDGRILFSQGRDLYLAEKDGSNPLKLLSAEGRIGEPSISPDSKHLVFTVVSSSASSIVVSNVDGSGRRAIVDMSEGRRVCCAQWTPDGRYIVFEDQSRGRGTFLFRDQDRGQPDLWIAQWQTGFFQRAQPPVQLTNGPLSYTGPIPSRDGKQVFAIGAKQRGELVRFDVNTKQFVPILPGISAFGPTFSGDGKWVAYTSYPDGSLWRSRSDGTDRLQLTYPPAQVRYPFISADGTRVTYGNTAGEIYVVSVNGGSAQRIAEKNSAAASWSPDGNALVYADYSDLKHAKFQFYDLRTGQRSVVPESHDLMEGVQWVAEDMLVAATQDRKKLVVFSIKTQEWSELVSLTGPDNIVNWAHAPDYKYVYYATGGSEPQAVRVRLADHKVEMITSLKDLPRATGPDGNTQISVAPDGSPIFTRDIGTQEIYALTIKWP